MFVPVLLLVGATTSCLFAYRILNTQYEALHVSVKLVFEGKVYREKPSMIFALDQYCWSPLMSVCRSHKYLSNKKY